MSHTPTPWRISEVNSYTEAIFPPEEHDGGIVAICVMGSDSMNHFDQHANARRIVACVNACAPFKDPLVEIPAMLLENQQLKDKIAELEKPKEKGYFDYLEDKDNESKNWRNQ